MDGYKNNSTRKHTERKRKLSDWPNLETVTKNYFTENEEPVNQHCWIDYIPKKKVNHIRRRLLSGLIILLIVLAVGTVITRYPQIVERIQEIRS